MRPTRHQGCRAGRFSDAQAVDVFRTLTYGTGAPIPEQLYNGGLHIHSALLNVLLHG